MRSHSSISLSAAAAAAPHPRLADLPLPSRAARLLPSPRALDPGRPRSPTQPWTAVDAAAARLQDAKGDLTQQAVQRHARRRIDPATTSSSLQQPRLISVPYDMLAVWVAGAQVRASHSLFPEAGDLHTTPFTTSSTYPFRYRT